MDNKTQEPSMEEILASIRKILSEDEDEARGKEEKPQSIPSPPDPEPADVSPEPAPPLSLAEEDNDILELTDAVVLGDEEEPLLLQAEPVPSLKPESVLSESVIPESVRSFLAESQEGKQDDRLLSPPTEAFSSAVFSELAAVARGRSMAVGTSGLTIEDIVRDLLRFLLKEWLDQNLPSMVEKLVRKEIERLVSSAEKP